MVPSMKKDQTWIFFFPFAYDIFFENFIPWSLLTCEILLGSLEKSTDQSPSESTSVQRDFHSYSSLISF